MEWAIAPSGAWVPAPKVTDNVVMRGLRSLCDPNKKKIWSPAEHLIDEMNKFGIVFAGMSDAVERKAADTATGKTLWTVTAPTFLALLTVAATDTDTSASLTDATYTGYARLSFAAADWNAASTTTGVTTATAPVAGKTWGAVTAGSSTCIGWGRTSVVSGAGDLIMFGALTSVTFSTTQTPPTIAASALVETWD